jgi:hypothetical protein
MRSRAEDYYFRYCRRGFRARGVHLDRSAPSTPVAEGRYALSGRGPGARVARPGQVLGLWRRRAD